MPYTLMKGLAWILIAVLLGIVIGWLLRSVAAKRQVERARAANLGAADQAELERLRARVQNLEPIVVERDRLRADLDAERRRPTGAAGPVAIADVPSSAAPTPVADGEERSAAEVLGRAVRPDDLTVVEGIGPKIAQLCIGIGIASWAELAVTEVSLLRTMLNDAGSQFARHDPSTWPQQAALLASGSWQEFVELTDRLQGGRPVD